MVCDGSITADVVPDGDVEDEVVVSTQLDEVRFCNNVRTFLPIFSKIVGIPFPCVMSFKSYLT